MQDFDERTAVITGAASGIGLALSRRFAAAGMKLALADVEAPALEAAAKQLEADGAEVLALVTDVSDPAAMDRLAAQVRERFDGTDLLCLNAGVSGGGGPIETLSTEDWAWALDVNLWGVIHGLRAFLGDMKQRDRGHIVITSSIAGIICSPQAAPYHATKHAVAAIAETLFRELHDAGSSVGVSCLCPGLVDTGFPRSERNRPAARQTPGREPPSPEQQEALSKAVGEIFARGATPEHVAKCVFDAVSANRFWVYTDEVHREAIAARHRALEAGEQPPTEFGALDGY
jgi:NADP-dependent 3-hydroxy acid dehydrogenase YdfG